MADVSSPGVVDLLNAAPATALCILVWWELRGQRALMRGQERALSALSTGLEDIRVALDLLAQLVGVKLKRKTGPVPIVRLPDDENSSTE